jgi:hypothetical protein
MTKKKNATIAAAAIVASLGLVFGTATAAEAATWVYPGSVSCSGYTAATETQVISSFATGITEHRVQGYGGYYYATWPSDYYVVNATKSWGYKALLSTRLGSESSGVTVSYYSVSCSG